MASKKGGLGKGLDALFFDNSEEQNGAQELRLSDIERNPAQPRREFDPQALEELAESIRTHGVLQPILVRPVGDSYEIVAGERRWRAARMAGLTVIPALVRELDDRQMAEMALVENLQREDLNPIEEAQGYADLMAHYDYTQEQVSKIVGKSRPAVANAARLLTLPDSVKEKVRSGNISAGHARALLGFDSEEKMLQAAEEIEKGNLTVRQAEKMAQKKETAPRGVMQREKLFVEMEAALGEALGRKIRIKKTAQGGKMEIEFFDEDDLRALAHRLES